MLFNLLNVMQVAIVYCILYTATLPQHSQSQPLL